MVIIPLTLSKHKQNIKHFYHQYNIMLGFGYIYITKNGFINSSGMLFLSYLHTRVVDGVVIIVDKVGNLYKGVPFGGQFFKNNRQCLRCVGRIVVEQYYTARFHIAGDTCHYALDRA